jgi:hypothetical protein
MASRQSVLGDSPVDLAETLPILAAGVPGFVWTLIDHLLLGPNPDAPAPPENNAKSRTHLSANTSESRCNTGTNSDDEHALPAASRPISLAASPRNVVTLEATPRKAKPTQQNSEHAQHVAGARAETLTAARLRWLASHRRLKRIRNETGRHVETDCSFAAWLTGRVLTGLHPQTSWPGGACVPSTFPRFGGGFVRVKWPRSASLGPTGKTERGRRVQGRRLRAWRFPRRMKTGI